MTVQELDTAFSRLSIATVEQLCTFDDSNVAWLSLMRRHGSRELAIAALREMLESCQTREQRLERLACFYCWMAPLPIMRPWTLMTIGDVVNEELFNETALLTRIADAIRDLGRETTFVTTQNDALVYGCLVVQDTGPPQVHVSHHRSNVETPTAHVISMCCWRSLPFMAVHATDAKVFPQLDYALSTVLGCDIDQLLRGDYDNLVDAYNAVLDYTDRGVHLRQQR